MLRVALARGLTAADFENMSVGMVVDFLVDCQNADVTARRGKESRRATQADIAAF